MRILQIHNRYRNSPGGEDIVVKNEYLENLEASEDDTPMLLLDVEITKELHLEGLARDIVRHVQQIRKEIDLQIQDHIMVDWHSEDENVQAAIDQHHEYICRETLCDNMTSADSPAQETREIKIGGAMVALNVCKS